jgi:N-formylglutamate amidohydrolase
MEVRDTLEPCGGNVSESSVHAGHSLVPGAAGSGTILHVPHSSTTIPPDVRQGILISDDELAYELALMTDAHTEVIAERAASAALSPPWIFVNRLSRLVVDPERFTDESEVMRRVGMGPVYTRTAAGKLLRADDASAELALLQAWFHPYAKAMTDLVEERLAAAGRVTIIDVHSFPSQRLPYEIGAEGRPAICLGTHPYHTPTRLSVAAREVFAACGDVDENAPFDGCYVPSTHFGTNARVSALMVEIRRDLYMAQPGGPPTDGMTLVAGCLTALIDALART